MRVVLDINILVSAAITSKPGQQGRDILDQAEESYILLLSDFMLWKLERVLHYNHIQSKYTHLTESAIQGFLTEVTKMADIVTERTVITEAEGSRDAEDNHILAAAVDGRADYLVTRNIAHFPPTFRSVTIIEPADFLQLLRDVASQEHSDSDDTP
ncbi:MAG: putative toxin-antitoxin system toxin component, PIN family, partial [bacterium]|nr:putative toxin-antitoxin system toxin component, PIN family [bacterium]